jgi:hypothetical protein
LCRQAAQVSRPLHRRLPRCLCRLPRCLVVPAFSLNAAGSVPVVVPNPCRRLQPHLPQRCAINATSLGASTASLDAAGSALSSSPTPVAILDPITPSLTSKVSSLSFFSPHGRRGQVHPSDNAHIDVLGGPVTHLGAAIPMALWFLGQAVAWEACGTVVDMILALLLRGPLPQGRQCSRSASPRSLAARLVPLGALFPSLKLVIPSCYYFGVNAYFSFALCARYCHGIDGKFG